MFKRLSGIFSRKPRTDPAAHGGLDPRTIEQAAAAKEAMEEFMPLLSRHLGEEESERLTANVLAQFDGSEVDDGWFAVSTFLLDGLIGQEGQQRDMRLMIRVDWKASDEIEWQANELLETRGIDDEWEWDADGLSVMDGLEALSDWLARHALTLVSVDFGQDSYFMFIVDHEIAARTVDAGRRTGMDVQTFENFAVSQAGG